MTKKSRIVTDQEYVEKLKEINRTLNLILYVIGVLFLVVIGLLLFYGG